MKTIGLFYVENASEESLSLTIELNPMLNIAIGPLF